MRTAINIAHYFVTIFRCPDTARIKKKMLYSSSFDALKKSLVGVQKYFQVSADAQIRQFIEIWATFRSLWQQFVLPKSLHF